MLVCGPQMRCSPAELRCDGAGVSCCRQACCCMQAVASPVHQCALAMNVKLLASRCCCCCREGAPALGTSAQGTLQQPCRRQARRMQSGPGKEPTPLHLAVHLPAGWPSALCKASERSASLSLITQQGGVPFSRRFFPLTPHRGCLARSLLVLHPHGEPPMARSARLAAAHRRCFCASLPPCHAMPRHAVMPSVRAWTLAATAAMAWSTSSASHAQAAPALTPTVSVSGCARLGMA